MRTISQKEREILKAEGKIISKPAAKANPEVRQAQALENLVSEIAKLTDKNLELLTKMIQELKPQPVQEWTELILIPERNNKNLIEKITVKKWNLSNTE